MRLLWVLAFVALGFLFQCGKSDDSVKDGDIAKDDDPPTNVKLSASEVTFNDVSGAVGATYTVSVSRPPAAEKTVEVTLTSTNPLLEVSPTEVTFTPTNASPQTITVKRANDANDMIMAEITDVITHDIATGTSHDAEFTEFAMMRSMVNVTVTLTPSKVELSTPEVTFNDVGGAVGATYTISVSRPPAAEKTVEITLTSTNEFLAVSPNVVTFTSTNATPQTITVKRANDADDIITTEMTGAIEHAITRGTELTEFAMMKSTVNVTVTPYTPDSDDDGLIEIWTATMLDNMRYNLAGTSYKTLATDPGNSSGCPDAGCNGYELMANVNLLPLLDVNGNGVIDMMTKTVAGKDHMVIDVNKDTGWVPVGDNANRFMGTFEGNGRTIANLWVNISFSGQVYAGLFGATDGMAAIRNVGVVSGGVSSSAFNSDSSGSDSSSGGLVGRSDDTLTITNSYFSGSGGVSSSSSDSFSGSDSSSGGLVGFSGDTLTITNSYFSGSGGVSSFSSNSDSSGSSSSSGGLVGSSSSLMITNSYFSGSDGVSSSSSSSDLSFSSSGGLVGFSDDTLTITNGYFSGSGGVSSSGGSNPDSFSYSGGLVGSAIILTIANSYFSGGGGVSSSSGFDFSSGGLVGFSFGPVMMDSYWNTDQISEAGGTGAVGLTLTQLKATSGTYPNLLGDAWDLGTDQQLPAVKRCILDMAGMGTCASYAALLGGQR